MELEGYKKLIVDYVLTDTEKEALKKSAEEFGEEVDEDRLTLCYKISLYASLLDGLANNKPEDVEQLSKLQ